jgi:hypothetical protein
MATLSLDVRATGNTSEGSEILAEMVPEAAARASMAGREQTMRPAAVSVVLEGAAEGAAEGAEAEAEGVRASNSGDVTSGSSAPVVKLPEGTEPAAAAEQQLAGGCNTCTGQQQGCPPPCNECLVASEKNVPAMPMNGSPHHPHVPCSAYRPHACSRARTCARTRAHIHTCTAAARPRLARPFPSGRASPPQALTRRCGPQSL